MTKLSVILPNIRSLYNIGSMFRTADAIGVEKIYLTGYSGRPDKQAKIGKTALGAEESVPWEYNYHTWQTIDKLKSEGCTVIGLEKSTVSKNYQSYNPKGKLALIVGNEKTGLSPAILKRCDHVLHLPMKGEKESLNVSVAFGVIGYYLTT